MINKVTIKEFIDIKKNNELIPIIDVRSPKEYLHAHIPNAINVSLFSDEEREDVGISYKEHGRETTMLLALKIVSPNMVSILESIINIMNKKSDILIHCARGGMRSEFLSYLLSMYGFDVHILIGGYKAYRNYVLSMFEREYKCIILSGYTGSAKTLILKEIEQKGENVVDLEGLANHKGSAFGGIGEREQPTQEQFENNLAYKLESINSDEPIWFEDESFLIGKCAIPKVLFNQMTNSYKCVFIDVDKSVRAEHISKSYGAYDKSLLRESIIKIRKRLGDVRMNEALTLLDDCQITECVLILLDYYDKSYRFNKLENAIYVKIDEMSFSENASLILSNI